jgi:peptide/nickel transport system permease protein
LGYFITSAVCGDLGTSVWSGHKVSTLIYQAIPHTILLAVTIMALSAIVGIGVGAFASARKNSILDHGITLATLIAVAIPSFVGALLLMLAFCIAIPIFPVLGGGEEHGILGIARHLVLPCLALTIWYAGFLCRLTRETMLQVLDEDYIRTARAFAAPRKYVIYKYALKNAVIPCVTVLGMGVGQLLGGALFVEIIFSRPGLGKLIVDAVYSRDLPVIQGGVLIATIMFVLANIIADITNAWLDPRIRYD